VVQLLASLDFEFEKFARAHPEDTLVTLRWRLVALLDDLRTTGKLGADPRAVALALFMTAHGLAVFVGGVQAGEDEWSLRSREGREARSQRLGNAAPDPGRLGSGGGEAEHR